MSNIIIDSKRKNSAFYINYKKILQEKINKVCRKIGFNDAEITWLIFDPNEKEKKNILDTIKIGLNGEDYGFCKPSENKIWISILSIKKDKDLSQINKIRSQLNILGDIEEDFLADVILDEITHIQTQCNHGSSQYNRKLQENANKYYYSPINRILLQNIKKNII